MSKFSEWFNNLVGIEDNIEDDDLQEEEGLRFNIAINAEKDKKLDNGTQSERLPVEISKENVFSINVEQFQDYKIIAEHLRNGAYVIANFEDCNPSISKEAFAFISGMAYGMNCRMVKIRKNLYVYCRQENPIDNSGKILSNMSDTISNFWTKPITINDKVVK